MPEVTQEQLDKLTSDATAGQAALKAADDYKKDMLKFKDAATAAQTQLESLTSAEAEKEKTRLTQQGEFKTLAEQEKTAREKAELEKKEALGKVDRFLKSTTLEKEAVKAGILETAIADLKLLKMDALTVGMDSAGNVDVKGAEGMIAELKKSRPHWFGQAKDPAFNDAGGGSDSTRGGTGALTAMQLAELSIKDPAKYKILMNEITKQNIEKFSKKK